MNKKPFLKQKFFNQLINKGNKNTSEKILLESIKSVQKQSSKKSKDLLLLSIINSTPILKMNKITKKRKRKLIKEVPTLIVNKNSRLSLSIKYILKMASENKEGISFNNKLTKEIIMNSQNIGNTIKFKNDRQKKILVQKRYLMNYKWNKKLSTNK